MYLRKFCLSKPIKFSFIGRHVKEELLHVLPDESKYDEHEERGRQDDLRPLVQPVSPPPTSVAPETPVDVEESVVTEETAGSRIGPKSRRARPPHLSDWQSRDWLDSQKVGRVVMIEVFES